MKFYSVFLILSLNAFALLTHGYFNTWSPPLRTFLGPLGTADLRKNVGLYTEFGTEVAKPRLESIEYFATGSGKLYKPEVLSPAGGWPQLKAAIANGADAVYFGLQEGFNARARASNFNIDELEEVMNYLHDRGAKGYLVINILVFDSEIDRLRELVPRIASAGVDALIMQDLGAAALVHNIAPNLPIHGSTQMSITDGKGVDFTQRLGLGIDRIVVGRELSITEISSIAQSAPVEIEAFVHGALCVSYSGQCFSSEAWGGRSANRGQCAQACRMPYGLIVNGILMSDKLQRNLWLHNLYFLLNY
jgi:collagenase-like PrtC family protease